MIDNVSTIKMAEEGYATLNEGPWAAAKRFAYLGSVEKVRVACINECGYAPPRRVIEAMLENREKRLERALSLGYIRRSEDAIRAYDAIDESASLNEVNARFLRALRAEREASDCLGRAAWL